MNYTYRKFNYTKKVVNKMYVLFENGDFLAINGSEIVALSIKVYDKLVHHCQGVSPVAESGFIKIKVSNKLPQFDSSFLYNRKEYQHNRKNYIFNRCINESIITSVWLFDENNFHRVILGNIIAKKDNDILVLEFSKLPTLGSSSSNYHNVCLGDLKKSLIHSIDLDFENCESMTIYNCDIVDIKLEFENYLDWTSSDLGRIVKSGYIRIKLTDSPHKANISKPYAKKRDLEQRLCGKNGKDCHDICHLYVTYYHTGYGQCLEECITVPDVKTDLDIQKIKEKEKEIGYEFDYYKGGYCQKLDDGSIVIAFGNQAEKILSKFCK